MAQSAWWQTVELLEMTTTGDKQSHLVALPNEGGKGLFTRELEEALLSGRAHLAVHSAKDLPTTLPDWPGAGRIFAAGPMLAMCSCAGRTLRHRATHCQRQPAPPGPGASMVATAWKWSELRGNLDTRLKKIAAGEADATFLAAAGLTRLGSKSFEGLVFEPISIEKMVPAAGQGAIALESRVEDVAKFSQPVCVPIPRGRFLLNARP